MQRRRRAGTGWAVVTEPGAVTKNSSRFVAMAAVLGPELPAIPPGRRRRSR